MDMAIVFFARILRMRGYCHFTSHSRTENRLALFLEMLVLTAGSSGNAQNPGPSGSRLERAESRATNSQIDGQPVEHHARGITAFSQL
ncbi:hypothetical protein [Sinorhizobium sp. RAC02]|uniref:hypothetical protein n=1 Tax=Sinorhizobium sp. RAC02 TaxID=1842534 RepID=UPI0012374C1F|nr:hypothetical protein [Sinorhizobium sp. RAC02]